MSAVDTRYRDAVKRVHPHIFALPMSDGWYSFDSENHDIITGPCREFEDIWKKTFWILARMKQIRNYMGGAERVEQ